MPKSIDDYLPKTRFQLPEGDCFVIGTMWDQETCRQLVLFQYVSPNSPAPVVEFAVSAASADAIIAVLQDSANQARYINGQRTCVYPPPIPEKPMARPNKRKQSSRKDAGEKTKPDLGHA
jgi:hypothetical protein